MRRKIYVTLTVILAIAILVAFGCAPKQTQKELLPCEVKVGCVTNEFAGSESLTVNTYLVVKNPNNVDIILDTLDYSILVGKGNEIVARKSIMPKTYIPANSEVGLTYASVVIFTQSLLMPRIYAGMGSSTAIAASFPTWKILGGKIPTSFWDAKATGLLLAGSTVDDVKAAIASKDMAKIAPLLGELATTKGTIAGTKAALEGIWKKAPDGPATYTIKGTAGIWSSIGTMEVPFETSYTPA